MRSLSDTVQAAESALVVARTLGNEDAEIDATLALADALERRGDSLRAHDRLREACGLLRRRGDGEATCRVELRAGLTAIRVRRLQSARRHLQHVEALAPRSEPTASVMAADIAAARMLLAAREGDESVADASANRAIAAALRTGSADVILRVARATGEAHVMLRRPVEARSAFTQALLLAGAAPRRGATVPQASEIFAVRLGLAKDDAGLEHLVEALRIAPVALEIPDAWHRLPSLVAALRRRAHDVRPHLDAVVTSAIEVVIAAARERSDTRADARGLEETLAEAGIRRHGAVERS